MPSSHADIFKADKVEEEEWHLPEICEDQEMFPTETSQNSTKLKRPTELKLILPPLGKPEQKIEEEAVTRFSLEVSGKLSSSLSVI